MNLRSLVIATSSMLLIVALLFAFPNGCTQPNEARRVLAAQGYTDIEMTGYRPFMGGRDYIFSTGFRAKSPNGTVVTGAVTSGAFKGYVVRLD